MTLTETSHCGTSWASCISSQLNWILRDITWVMNESWSYQQQLAWLFSDSFSLKLLLHLRYACFNLNLFSSERETCLVWFVFWLEHLFAYFLLCCMDVEELGNFRQIVILPTFLQYSEKDWIKIRKRLFLVVAIYLLAIDIRLNTFQRSTPTTLFSLR